MGSSSSSRNKIPNAQELMDQTGFSSAHLLRLYDRFESLDRDNRGYLSPDDFEALGGLAMNPVGGRIIDAFFSLGQDTVDFSSFVRILAHFRPTDRNRNKEGTQQELPNSRTRKLKFAFQLYDLDRDGKISREELLQMEPRVDLGLALEENSSLALLLYLSWFSFVYEVLRAMLGLQVTEEQLKSIAERAIQEADLDKDDAISFDEFKKSLEKVDIDTKMSVGFLK